MGNRFKYTVLTEDGNTGTVEMNGYVTPPFKPTQLIIEETIVHNDITYTVTGIGDDAFDWNILTSVTIPDNVTTIGDYAFSGNELTTVTIPNSVTTIRVGAFARNHLTSVMIPSSVTAIEYYAFMRNSISAIYLANKDMLSLLSVRVLMAATYKEGGSPGILEIYAPELKVKYKDDSNIIKKFGESFQIKAISEVVYQQIERFVDNYIKDDDSTNGFSFIGPDESATIKPCDLTTSTAYQWYKDGVAIEGATSPVYSEVAKIPGNYQYHVTVNDIVLEEIKVTINKKVVELGKKESFTF